MALSSKRPQAILALTLPEASAIAGTVSTMALADFLAKPKKARKPQN